MRGRSVCRSVLSLPYPDRILPKFSITEFKSGGEIPRSRRTSFLIGHSRQSKCLSFVRCPIRYGVTARQSVGLRGVRLVPHDCENTTPCVASCQVFPCRVIESAAILLQRPRDRPQYRRLPRSVHARQNMRPQPRASVAVGEIQIQPLEWSDAFRDQPQ
jgi:hypothetical protein